MKNHGLAIFVIFFGISLLDAVSSGQMLRAAFWVGIGLAFWGLDRMRREA